MYCGWAGFKLIMPWGRDGLLEAPHRRLGREARPPERPWSNRSIKDLFGIVESTERRDSEPNDGDWWWGFGKLYIFTLERFKLARGGVCVCRVAKIIKSTSTSSGLIRWLLG